MRSIDLCQVCLAYTPKDTKPHVRWSAKSRCSRAWRTLQSRWGWAWAALILFYLQSPAMSPVIHRSPLHRLVVYQHCAKHWSDRAPASSCATRFSDLRTPILARPSTSSRRLALTPTPLRRADQDIKLYDYMKKSSSSTTRSIPNMHHPWVFF